MSSNDDSQEPTIESLTKTKSEIFSEHGLEGTALGSAAEKLEQEEQVEESQREALVRKKVLLATAEQKLGADDPDVEALRADVHDLESELEAKALRAQHEDNLEEARQKIDNLEGLAQRADSQNQDRLAHNYRERAASLKAEFDLEDDESNRYDAEALVGQPDTGDDEAAEALQEFRDRQARKEADEELPQEAQEMLSNLKNMREQAKNKGHKELIKKYDERIEALREEHA